MQVSSAIIGAGYLHTRPYVIPYTTAALGTAKAIAPGCYYVVATTDCWARLSSANNILASALPANDTQPAVQAGQFGAFFCPAGAVIPVDVPSAMFLSAIAVSSSGNLNVTGPLNTSPMA